MQPDQENHQRLPAPDSGPGAATVTLAQAVTMAVAMQRNNQLPQAEAIFDRVLQADPDCADALHFLGVLRHQQGRRDEAIALIRRAIESAPNYPDAYNNLGNVLRAMGRFPEALEAFQKAAELGPQMAEAQLNLAGMLRKCNRLTDAAEAYRRAIGLNPELSDAHHHLGNVLYMMGMIEEAGDAFANWQALDPQNPVARHLAAACGAGAAPTRASDDFVRVSFDQFAEGFEQKMQTLQYGGPDLITSAIAALYQPAKDLDVLDAGCGTGLCGPLLAPFARTLIGIDLSAGMIKKARARGVYDELIVAELTGFLATSAASFDLIASADTLCYFGLLDSLMAGAARCLRPGGHFVFTVEALDDAAGGEFVLNPHGRYSHRRDYLRRCAQAAGLEIRAISEGTLRQEMNQPVGGFVVTAQKASQRNALE